MSNRHLRLNVLNEAHHLPQIYSLCASFKPPNHLGFLLISPHQIRREDLSVFLSHVTQCVDSSSLLPAPPLSLTTAFLDCYALLNSSFLRSQSSLPAATKLLFIKKSFSHQILENCSSQKHTTP